MEILFPAVYALRHAWALCSGFKFIKPGLAPGSDRRPTIRAIASRDLLGRTGDQRCYNARLTIDIRAIASRTSARGPAASALGRQGARGRARAAELRALFSCRGLEGITRMASGCTCLSRIGFCGAQPPSELKTEPDKRGSDRRPTTRASRAHGPAGARGRARAELQV